MMTYREMEERNGCFAVIGFLIAIIIIVSLL